MPMIRFHVSETVVFWFNAIVTSAGVASAWVNLILNFDKLILLLRDQEPVCRSVPAPGCHRPARGLIGAVGLHGQEPSSPDLDMEGWA
jgi:hypothetical protein